MHSSRLGASAYTAIRMGWQGVYVQPFRCQTFLQFEFL